MASDATSMKVSSCWLANAGRTRGSYLHSAAIANFGVRVSAIWHLEQARKTPQGKACGCGHGEKTQQLTEIGPVLAAGVGLNLRRHALAACQIRSLLERDRACLLIALCVGTERRALQMTCHAVGRALAGVGAAGGG